MPCLELELYSIKLSIIKEISQKRNKLMGTYVKGSKEVANLIKSITNNFKINRKYIYRNVDPEPDPHQFESKDPHSECGSGGIK